MKTFAIATIFLLVSSTSVFAGSVTDKGSGDMTEDQAIEAVEKEMAENPTAAGPAPIPITEGEMENKGKEEMEDVGSTDSAVAMDEETTKTKSDY